MQVELSSAGDSAPVIESTVCVINRSCHTMSSQHAHCNSGNTFDVENDSWQVGLYGENRSGKDSFCFEL